MIFAGTRLKVIDNSGAKEVECIRLYGRSASVKGSAGDIFIGTIKEAQPNKKLKQGDLVRCVITTTKKPKIRKTGIGVRFDLNTCVVVNAKNIPVGTRLLGPVMLELRAKGFSKILSMATVSI